VGQRAAIRRDNHHHSAPADGSKLDTAPVTAATERLERPAATTPPILPVVAARSDDIPRSNTPSPSRRLQRRLGGNDANTASQQTVGIVERSAYGPDAAHQSGSPIAAILERS